MNQWNNKPNLDNLRQTAKYFYALSIHLYAES